MAKGDTFQDEIFRYEDAYSGREIIRLTDYFGHSNHMYFTDPCWYNEGKSFIFTSDRGGKSNLYGYNLDTFTITQLTDLERSGAARPGGCYSKTNNAHYYWWNRQIIELNMDTLAERVVYEAPEDMEPTGRPGANADGTYICTRLAKKADEGKAKISFAYSSFRDQFYAKPFSQILRIEIATGKVEPIHEDYCYITHENCSPKLPDIMTFCHEGPWHLVEQRIWGLNIQTGETWKIRPQEGQGIAVGHEYWFEDGETIGYHGFPRDRNGDHIYGHIKWDNSDHVEVSFPYRSTHFCSQNEKLIAGDGSPAAVFSHQGEAQPFIQLFNWDGEKYAGPRVLAYHRSTFNDQHAHCHPRFTPDGKYVMYASDLTKYANIYLVEVGNIDELPFLSKGMSPQHT
ncbi:MAG: PD40 domain-containing protein [Trueperaceae bacterium]|nr:PD40 domain-containing protein [Trueperaceae bacterium]